MATAQDLRATHRVDERVKGVDERVMGVDERVQGVGDKMKGFDDKIDVIIDGARFCFAFLSHILS
jgi:hypothetical protein